MDEGTGTRAEQSLLDIARFDSGKYKNVELWDFFHQRTHLNDFRLHATGDVRSGRGFQLRCLSVKVPWFQFFDQPGPFREVGPNAVFPTSQQDMLGMKLTGDMNEQVLGREDGTAAYAIEDHVAVYDRQ